MSSKNDDAWQKYITAKGIELNGKSYDVRASELAELTGREPRLLAKFDAVEHLPRPLRDAGYSLFPTRNGMYQLMPGDMFVSVFPCEDNQLFIPKLPFPLLTSGRGSGESQYIDFAHNAGLLSQFMGTGPMYQTIRGREYSTFFRFHFNDIEVNTESVQIEVDSGYETLHEIILVEAKIGFRGTFNVRQIYYPFRHFSTLFPTKVVRNLFMAYDIPSSTYHLYEYVFPEPTKPLSMRVKRSASYRVMPSQQNSIFNLVDSTFRTVNNTVPQADNLNRLFELLEVIDAGINTGNDVADYFVFDVRQSNYYREAAEYLGLVEHDRQAYYLTDNGLRILSASVSERSGLFARAIVNSWIFVALIERAHGMSVFTMSDIESVIAGVRSATGTPRYTQSTILRRRQTIISWIRWLSTEFGVFEVHGEQVRLC